MTSLWKIAALILVSASTASAQPTQPSPQTFPYRDLTKELANKVTGTYVVAATGDLLIQEPIGKLIDPKIQQILRDADTTVGNMEALIIDRRNWTNDVGFAGNWSPKETAADVAALGFDLLNGANNHTWDMREEGLKSTIKYLDEQGIPLAGVGPNLATARMPVFQYTAKGRVGMVGAYAVSDGNVAAATDRRGTMGGGWGLNPLRLALWNVVTPAQLLQLKGIRDSIVARRGEPDIVRPIPIPKDDQDRVRIFANNYMAGPKPGEYHYEMNQSDLRGNLTAIRNAKEYGDFAIFTMHVHQNRYAFQLPSNDHYPPNFLIEFTHALIDNGADMYVGHGNHTIQGVEIYKGRPIFYNLGNFAVHEILLESDGAAPGVTAVEADELSTDSLQHPENLVATVATSRYQDGKLVEVRLYPIELGVGKSRPWSRMSIAQTPSPALAQEILTNVQKYSEPFGTKISIENGVGVIRIAPEATAPVGTNIRTNRSR